MTRLTNGDGLRKRRAHPFVAIPKPTIRDKRLSIRARGLLGILLDLPDDFVINLKFLCAEVDTEGSEGEGREAISTALRELRRLGYYRVERRHMVADGTFRTGAYVSDEAVPEWAEEHRAACAAANTKTPRWDCTVKVLPDGSVEGEGSDPWDTPASMTERDGFDADGNDLHPVPEKASPARSPETRSPAHPVTGYLGTNNKTENKTENKRTTDPMSSHLGNARGASRPRRPPTAEIDPSPVTQSGPVAEMDGPGYLRDWQALRERLSGKKPGAYGATG